MKKIKRTAQKSLSILVALTMLLCVTPLGMMTSATDYVSTVTLTFSDSGITASDSTAIGFSISGTTLTLSEAGVYTVTGSCSNGNIEIKKNTTDIVLILENLELNCDYSTPLACGKTSDVMLFASGASTLINSENPENETSEDTEIADAFEGGGIKVKSGAALTIEGDGTLFVDGSACKNGIKGASTSTVTVNMAEEGTLKISAANNGLASDGEVIIKSGNLDITAGNEGIKSEPDADDTDSLGVVTINGGNIKIDTVALTGGDGIQALNGINITGGTFDIDAYNDGIQSNADLLISNGTFDIKTLNGYNSSDFDPDTMSCKGLKASATDDETTEAANQLTVTYGNFKINTADDAVHSDGSIDITGGNFDIYTGDDGVHADVNLNLGSSEGLERDPYICVNYSYEALEAGNVYVNGGKHYAYATDDGINAAGGSSDGSTTTPGWGGSSGKDHFRPGSSTSGSTSGSTTSSTYSLNINGGSVFVNAGGDGLDSNGALNLNGGNIAVWAASSGDNEPLEYDGSLYVNGATVLAAGCAGMGQAKPTSGSQSYNNYSTNFSANSIISIKNSNTTVYNAQAPKSGSYIFFSSPTMSTSYTVSASTSGSIDCSLGNSWSHSWDDGIVTKEATTTETGIITYTCTCGATEKQTLPVLTEEVIEEPEIDAGYNVTFDTDAHALINIYYTQDYSVASETDVTNAVSRNSDTGEPDSSGDGQINFTVIVEDGYVLESVVATEGLYKNIKDVSSDSGIANTYRVTKITGDITITVITAVDSGEVPEADAGYNVTFNADEHASINIYYTQNYSVASETDVTNAVSRNSDTGEPDSSGDGQINFTVIVEDGYILESVAATEGLYKNIKDVSSNSGIANTYRVTKITGDITITITTVAISEILSTKNGCIIDTENKIIYGLCCGLTSIENYLICLADNYSLSVEASDAYIGTGSVINIINGSSIVDSYTVIIFGDVNGDSFYDGNDAFIVELITNGMLSEDSLESEILVAADCNHDGIVDNADVTLLNKAGLMSCAVEQTRVISELTEYEVVVTQEAPIEESSNINKTIITTILEFIKNILTFIFSLVK